VTLVEVVLQYRWVAKRLAFSSNNSTCNIHDSLQHLQLTSLIMCMEGSCGIVLQTTVLRVPPLLLLFLQESAPHCAAAVLRPRQLLG
jgi:hypothetical protein